MKVSELANRYAKAVFELASDNRTAEKVFDDLRGLDEAFSKDKETHSFLTSPLVTAAQRTEVLKKALDNKGVSKEAVDLVMLLANKDRFGIFSQLVHAFERLVDASNNVGRGTVRSATVLGPEERKRIEETVEKVLNKKVIMTYKVDASVIGGLVAQVGSYTFDDGIDSRLRRMNEELNRRTV